MTTQVVFISGGEVFKTREDFKKWLSGPDSDFMLPQPGMEPVTFWSRGLQDLLGDDYEVLSITMPLKKHARYDEWKIWFEKHIQFMDSEVVFVGWSLGANFFAKYLAENNFKKEIRSLHLVAGCYGWNGQFEMNKDLPLIEQQVEKIHLYYSEDDSYDLEQEHAGQYIHALPSAQVNKFIDRGHFLQEEFPELITNIKNS